MSALILGLQEEAPRETTSTNKVCVSVMQKLAGEVRRDIQGAAPYA